MLFLAAQNLPSYDLAQSSGEQLGRLLDGRIVRQGHSLELQTPDRQEIATATFKVIMTEPTLQGVVDAATTQFFVTLADDADTPSAVASTSDRSAQNGEINGNAPTHEQDGEVDHELDLDTDIDIDIDERFLASSVLEQYDTPHFAHDGQDGLPHANGHAVADGFLPPDGELSKASQLNGHTSTQPFEAAPLSDRSLLLRTVASWRERESAQDSTASKPVQGQGEDVDEESAVLVGEQGLAALGAFDGDWVRVSSPAPTRG